MKPTPLTEGQYGVLFNYAFIAEQIDESCKVQWFPAWTGQRAPMEQPQGRVHRIEDDEP